MVRTSAEAGHAFERVFLAASGHCDAAHIGGCFGYLFPRPYGGSGTVLSFFRSHPRRLAEGRRVCALAGWTIPRHHCLIREHQAKSVNDVVIGLELSVGH